MSDGRKANSAETREKKSTAAKESRAVGVFVVKRNQSREKKLQENIDRVVAMALARDAEIKAAGQDVVRHNRLRMSFRVRGTKVG